MWRWVVGIACVLVALPLLYYAMLVQYGAENRAGLVGGAYSEALNHRLIAYLQDHPDRTALLAAFRTAMPDQGPCDPLNGSAPAEHCRAVTGRSDLLWPLIDQVIPRRVVLRIPPTVWADPGARQALLDVAHDRSAVCADVAAHTYWRQAPVVRRDLGCEGERRPPANLWVNVVDIPQPTCERLTPGASRCAYPRVDDSRAFRLP